MLTLFCLNLQYLCQGDGVVDTFFASTCSTYVAVIYFFKAAPGYNHHRG